MTSVKSVWEYGPLKSYLKIKVVVYFVGVIEKCLIYKDQIGMVWNLRCMYNTSMYEVFII